MGAGEGIVEREKYSVGLLSTEYLSTTLVSQVGLPQHVKTDQTSDAMIAQHKKVAMNREGETRWRAAIGHTHYFHDRFATWLIINGCFSTTEKFCSS